MTDWDELGTVGMGWNGVEWDGMGFDEWMVTAIWKGDNRGPLIDQYNAKVAEFTAQRTAFSQLSVNISLIRLSPLSTSAANDLTKPDYDR